MAQFRNQSPSLQELIDGYNDEIMRYSRMSHPAEMPSDTAQETGERQKEQGEFEAERGATERKYWQGEGKYAHKNHRPEATEPLEPPMTAAVARSGQQEQWMRDLEQGLRDLEQGLKELAEGQRELREGQLEYQRGIEERDKWSGAQPQPAVCPNCGARLNGGAMAVNDEFSPEDASDYAPRYNPPAQSQVSVPSDGEGSGMLQVSVYTARQATPIPGALVRVFRVTPSGREEFASYYTDEDGVVPPIRLPAGKSPAGSVAAPFVNYSVAVAADGYYPRNDLRAQIFDGISAQLQVEMTPLPDDSWR